jgi:hypothetical protein
MEWHTLSKSSFICTRNEEKSEFDEGTILIPEKGNQILGNFAIDEMGIFKIMHEDTHTHTHI